MSRVDDERDAARAAARLAEAKRTDQALKTKRAQEGAAFSKLVQGQKKEAQVAHESSSARSAIEQLIEAAEAGTAQEGEVLEHTAREGQEQASAFQNRLGAKDANQRQRLTGKAQGEGAERTKFESDQGTEQALGRGAAEQGQNAQTSQRRGAEGKVGRERLEDRREASESSSSNASASAGGASKGKGELKTDADQSGGGQQQGGKDKEGAPPNPSMRFNPALMAPVGVAKPKEASGSDRLRKVANEVAQKIVERVRVGTNALGRAEFQIDLRSDVLSGLSVKISAKNGKISAVFQGSDRDVLKLLQEQSEALKAALGARGLTLEELKIEARG